MPTDQPAMKSKSEILGDPRPLPNSLGMRLTNVDAVKRPVEGARSTIGNISHRLLSSARRGLSPARNKAERIFVSDGIDAILLLEGGAPLLTCCGSNVTSPLLQILNAAC